MKIIICISILCCAICSNAQHYYGQWNCNFSGSYAPEGYGIRLGSEKAIGYTYSSIRGEVAFFNTRKDISTIRDIHCDIHSYSLSLGYTYSLEKHIPHAFYFNPATGILVGLEKFHGKLPHGVIRTQSNHLLLGFYILVQAEIKLTPLLSVYIEPVGNYRIKTSLDKYAFYANLGLKLYFPR